MKKVLKKIGVVLAYVLIFVCLLALASAHWAASRWSELSVDELLMQMQTLQGTGGGMLEAWIVQALLPAAAVLAGLIVLRMLIKKHRTLILILELIFGGLCLFGGYQIINSKMDITGWAESRNTYSDYLQQNYVDPSSVQITFPEKKRNLIFIYLESMEMTYASKDVGGALDQNCIPELTDVAFDNECFRGNSDKLDGAESLYGATWTMGAMFGSTSGLPLKLDIDENDMDTQASFFPQIRTLGDILHDNGYRQMLLVGSDASFGGRKLYFQTHGNYEIDDYYTAVEKGRIDKDYYVWWGYEDAKLIEYAKEDLTELAKGDQPFNFTMLTADTHFPDGYVCPDCGDEFGDNQYANVIACSSRRITEFLQWIQQQDFYDNTTVVITGDHPTMDPDFLNGISDDYTRRVLTACINAAPAENSGAGSTESKEEKTETGSSSSSGSGDGGPRVYCTFDEFPTTIAALGATIEGNRLGLGTNLYSGEPTLLERDGRDKMQAELQKKSSFVAGLEKVDVHSDKLEKLVRAGISSVIYTDAAGRCYVEARVTDPTVHISRFKLTCRKSKDEKAETIDLKQVGDEGDSLYQANLSLAGWQPGESRLSLAGYDDAGDKYKDLLVYSGDPQFMKTHYSIEYYLEMLQKLPDKYAILVAASDDASAGLSGEIVNDLHAIGLQTDLTGKYRYSYLAVLDAAGSGTGNGTDSNGSGNGNAPAALGSTSAGTAASGGRIAEEQLSADSVCTTSGMLRDGATCEIRSMGANVWENDESADTSTSSAGSSESSAETAADNSAASVSGAGTSTDAEEAVRTDSAGTVSSSSATDEEEAADTYIRINGEDCLVCGRGLNFVLYDTEKGIVADSAVFDTYLASPKMELQNFVHAALQGDRLIVTVDEDQLDLVSIDTITTVYAGKRGSYRHFLTPDGSGKWICDFSEGTIANRTGKIGSSGVPVGKIRGRNAR